MNRILRKSLIGLAIFITLLLTTLIVIAGFFQEAVGKRLITEINKQLTTELTVGSFQLSLLRGFPNATIHLQNVVVKGRDGGGLLEAKDMAFHFRLLSLFGPNVKVHSVKISDGALVVGIDKKGRANYDIFQLSTEAEEEGDFHISLKKALLQNVELAYRDEKLAQEMLFRLDEADFSGELSSKKFDLTSTAKLTSHFVDMGGVRYFAGKNWGYDANILVDMEKGDYDFNKVKLNLEGNSFNLSGKVKQEKGLTDFDLVATADDADISSVIALLPDRELELLSGFSSKGKFHFSLDVMGKLGPKQNPHLEATFSLDDGSLTHPYLKEPFKDVSFEAVFTNGESNSLKTSSFEIKDFKGYLHRELLTMHLKVEELDEPFVDFQMDGALPMGYIYGFFQHPGITGGGGEIEINNLDISGLFSDMTSTANITGVDAKGSVDFDNASLLINGEKIALDKGSLLFDGNNLSLQDWRIEGAGNDIRLSGSASNLLPVLFADSVNSKNAKLVFSGEMHAPKMDLLKLRQMADVPVAEGSVEQTVYDSLNTQKYLRREQFTDFLQGTFSAKVDEFSYNKITGENFSGNLSIENSQLKLEGTATGMDGKFALQSTVFFQKEPRLEAKLSGDKIDVNKFFYQTENAGQTFLTHEHISGTMNTKMLIHAFWDSTGHFLTDKLHVWAGLGIEDGALKGFSLLEEFSAFVKVSDLRNVRFEDMQNWLEIKDSKFYLPVMFLQNNAMNMSVCGEQTFDDKIDYSIKVNAGQVLANKFKSGSNEKPIKAKKDGFFNLYFNVHGTLDKYKYETNKRKVKDMFDRSERQKQRIRAALIEAFGAPLNMLREPTDWLDDGETARLPKNDDVEYIEGF